MSEPVDHRAGESGVTEDVLLMVKSEVCSDDNRILVVARRQQIEQ
jgi:hypothetical protein